MRRGWWVGCRHLSPFAKPLQWRCEHPVRVGGARGDDEQPIGPQFPALEPLNPAPSPQTWLSMRARLSQTQQWTPRRPEYTQRRCMKPKSSSSARSTILMAVVMNGQHLWQMAAPLRRGGLSSVSAVVS